MFPLKQTSKRHNKEKPYGGVGWKANNNAYPVDKTTLQKENIWHKRKIYGTNKTN